MMKKIVRTVHGIDVGPRSKSAAITQIRNLKRNFHKMKKLKTIHALRIFFFTICVGNLFKKIANENLKSS